VFLTVRGRAAEVIVGVALRFGLPLARLGRETLDVDGRAYPPGRKATLSVRESKNEEGRSGEAL
jgi:hypothetical protein